MTGAVFAAGVGRGAAERLGAIGGSAIGAAFIARDLFSNVAGSGRKSTPISWHASAQGAEFAVQDSGIGIDPKHIPRLTERFYRIDRGRSRDSGGTGLGLAIVKHSLNRHQAQLDIRSEVGKGSRFAARFPASRVCNG